MGIDCRGTTITEQLLDALLLTALFDSTTGRPHLGTARFGGATFTGRADFRGATFTGNADFSYVTFTSDTRFDDVDFAGEAWFNHATFGRDVSFDDVTFAHNANFDGAAFTRADFRNTTFTSNVSFRGTSFTDNAWYSYVAFPCDADFEDATFTGDAGFGNVTFTGNARFRGASFTGNAWFGDATFTHDTEFDHVTFIGDAQFSSARFERAAFLGPLNCGSVLNLSEAVFSVPVTIQAAAEEVRCVRTRWDATVSLRLRYAKVDLSDAVLTQPTAVTTHPTPFPNMHASDFTGEPTVKMTSLRGIDAAHLVLTDTDLGGCVFTGAFHLDQLRLAGRTRFASVPTGIIRDGLLPMRFTRRRTLVEEHHWRATRTPTINWVPGAIRTADPALAPKPYDLAPLYRDPRKAFEDAKNEPGAADFYYGEMEMRRHDGHDTTRAERGLITAYWCLSGYGLRASRALGWLLLAIATTVVVMMLWGLPTNDPKSESTGKVTNQTIRLATDTSAPVNPSGPLHERVSTNRFEKSLRVVVNSVIFRSSGQNLTTVGTYTEMGSRLTEPVLLGLAALAIRGRIKR
ncbi:pentapeptide repeat-containing protein [Streptomyces sp. NPDC060035]|uniref:pentapeptide repeat-containing protein n=1 Tax=Streptomyces sp. NPDC060035 TaxID=3347044 RepID=UPI0036A646DA